MKFDDWVAVFASQLRKDFEVAWRTRCYPWAKYVVECDSLDIRLKNHYSLPLHDHKDPQTIKYPYGRVAIYPYEVFFEFEEDIALFILRCL